MSQVGFRLKAARAFPHLGAILLLVDHNSSLALGSATKVCRNCYTFTVLSRSRGTLTAAAVARLSGWSSRHSCSHSRRLSLTLLLTSLETFSFAHFAQNALTALGVLTKLAPTVSRHRYRDLYISPGLWVLSYLTIATVLTTAHVAFSTDGSMIYERLSITVT